MAINFSQESSNSLNELLSSSDKLKRFDEFYSQKLRAFMREEFAREPECLKRIVERFEQMIDYNVPHGKKLRGLCVYESFLSLQPTNADFTIDLKSVDQAKAIGWCIEFVIRYYLKCICQYYYKKQIHILFFLLFFSSSYKLLF